MTIHNPGFAPGSVTALLDSDLVLPQTKQVLQQRMNPAVSLQPVFFSEPAFAVLQAVCNRLIPQQDHQPVALAAILDEQLYKNHGNGWRYDRMPPDQESFLNGMEGINQAANQFFQNDFTALGPSQQEDVLRAVQLNNVSGSIWQTLPPDLFFEELLSRLVEIYYSHPQVKDTIGDASFADASGWQQIRLNEREPHEPMPQGGTTL